MSSNDGDITGALILGFGAGLVWFFKGFRVYRQYRVLADTPEMPLRSIAMGLVEVHGKAQPVTDKLATSPVSQTPCLFYKVDIERYQRNSKGGGSWQHYKTDADGVPFYLDDGTGKVLVDAHGAEYDLIQSCRRTAGRGQVNLGRLGSLFGTKSSPAPAIQSSMSDSALIAYAQSAANVGGSAMLNSLGNLALGGGLSFGGGRWNLGVGGSGQYRFTEYCILPGHWYDVTGTCAENPSPRDETDRNMILKGKNEPTFLISWRNERGIEGELRKRAALHIFGGAALSVVCLAILLGKLGWLV
jgi:hypothetical protein